MPSISTQAQPIALWQLGFRPFYLLASLFAALSIPLWVLQYAGTLPAPYVNGPLWHGYEMLVGYTTAVITGFLFTAVRTWSGQPTPTGLALAGFALLWLVGRIMVFLPYPLAAMTVNAAFPLAVAIGVAVPLVRAANRRNYFVIALLLFLGIASLVFQAGSRGMIALPALLTLQAGLDVVLLLITVIAGRVVPMFSNNGVPGMKATRNPLLEKLAIGTVAALLLADLLQPPPAFLAVLAGVAAVVHAARLVQWQPWRTLATPLVWILHVAYVWVVGYLLLRGLAALDMVPVSLALHGLTIGVIGSVTIGMMARTSLGHTGRPLTTGWLELACFLLVQGAAIARVGGGLLFTGGSTYLWSVIVAGVCWSAAFILFTAGYAPIWVRPRLDGKPG
ncbi:MAG: NnrS [Herminiimonas sp.]|nr:NnrS [Herminiimonas sp.]